MTQFLKLNEKKQYFFNNATQVFVYTLSYGDMGSTHGSWGATHVRVFVNWCVQMCVSVGFSISFWLPSTDTFTALHEVHTTGIIQGTMCSLHLDLLNWFFKLLHKRFTILLLCLLIQEIKAVVLRVVQ